MKNCHTFILCLFIGIGSLSGQEIKAVLTNDGIDHFIKSFKPMTAELEALGHTMNEDSEDTNPMAGFASLSGYIQGLMTKDDVTSILEKYDYDEKYGFTYIAISMGYLYNTMNSELEKMDAKEKEMAKPIMDMFLNQILLMVHKDDIEMLKSRMADLDAVFEDM